MKTATPMTLDASTLLALAQLAEAKPPRARTAFRDWLRNDVVADVLGFLISAAFVAGCWCTVGLCISNG